MNKLICPNCDTTIPATNINVQTMVAVCPNCDMVFSFQAPGTAAPPAKSKRLRVEPPRHVTIEQHGDQIDIRYRWWGRYGAGKYLIVGLGIAVTVLFVLMNISLQRYPPDSVLMNPFAVGGLISLMVLFAAYVTASLVLNHTRFRLNSEHFTVRSLPLPWGFGSRRHTQDVDMVIARPSGRFDRHRKPMQNLYAIRHDGVPDLLLTQMDYDAALAVEQSINNYLDNDTQNTLTDLFDLPIEVDEVETEDETNNRRYTR